MELVIFNIRKREVKKHNHEQSELGTSNITPFGKGFFKALTLLLALVEICWRSLDFKKDTRLQSSVCLLNLKP